MVTCRPPDERGIVIISIDDLIVQHVMVADGFVKLSLKCVKYAHTVICCGDATQHVGELDIQVIIWSCRVF